MSAQNYENFMADLVVLALFFKITDTFLFTIPYQIFILNKILNEKKVFHGYLESSIIWYLSIDIHC